MYAEKLFFKFNTSGNGSFRKVFSASVFNDCMKPTLSYMPPSFTFVVLCRLFEVFKSQLLPFGLVHNLFGLTLKLLFKLIFLPIRKGQVYIVISI